METQTILVNSKEAYVAPKIEVTNLNSNIALRICDETLSPQSAYACADPFLNPSV